MAINMLETKAKDPTDAVFGVDSDGIPFHACLSEGPHWIVCGQSGSGKSVTLNQLAVSIMSHSHPSELQIMAIDPKMVEFAKYKDLPYCPIDPVIDMGNAYGLVAYLVIEMERRYDRLKDAGVRNLKDFNTWLDDRENNIEIMKGRMIKDNDGKDLDAQQEALIERLRTYEKMPYMVCIIDEYADMIMQDKERAIEGLIVRLAQKARAAGITLIIATQRPSVDVISGIIKSNIPARIGMTVTDSNNSQIILDQNGCEKLKGKGDSLVKFGDGPPTRVQGVFISDGELDVIFDALKEKYGKPKKIDYKQIAVDEGYVEWVEEYDDDVPMEDRFVRKPSRRRGMI